MFLVGECECSECISLGVYLTVCGPGVCVCVSKCACSSWVSLSLYASSLPQSKIDKLSHKSFCKTGPSHFPCQREHQRLQVEMSPPFI